MVNISAVREVKEMLFSDGITKLGERTPEAAVLVERLRASFRAAEGIDEAMKTRDDQLNGKTDRLMIDLGIINRMEAARNLEAVTNMLDILLVASGIRVDTSLIFEIGIANARLFSIAVEYRVDAGDLALYRACGSDFVIVGGEIVEVPA